MVTENEGVRRDLPVDAATLIDPKTLSRVVLYVDGEHLFEEYGLSVEFQVQDDGQTLKLWARRDNPEAKERARVALARDNRRILEEMVGQR